MISTKTCSKCKIEKPFSEFNKGKGKFELHVWCRQCYKKWASEHYKKHKDKITESHRLYYRKNRYRIRKHERERSALPESKAKRKAYQQANAEHIREYQREYRKRNIKHIRERQRRYYHANKDKHKAWKKKWQDTHQEELKASRKRYREENREQLNKKAIERLHKDPIHKMKEQTRNMVRYALRSKGHRKTSRTATIVGCDLNKLCGHLFSTWEKNYGTKWDGEPYHIDHIIPLSTAKTEEGVIALCHYTNLQMLTPEDNMKKSNKIK